MLSFSFYPFYLKFLDDCVYIAFRPFSGKEENTLRSKRQTESLLSEVIFLQPATATSSDMSASSTDENRFVTEP